MKKSTETRFNRRFRNATNISTEFCNDKWGISFKDHGLNKFISLNELNNPMTIIKGETEFVNSKFGVTIEINLN